MAQLLGLLGLLYLFYKFGFLPVLLFFVGLLVLASVLVIAIPDRMPAAPIRRRTRKGRPPAMSKTRLAAPVVDADMGHVQSGLVIDEPWISKILAGEKVWEMRSAATRKRGRIALVKKGSGTLVGLATIKDVLGPFDEAQIGETFEFHKVPTHAIGKWRHAWVLEDVVTLTRPIPYVHRPGAVIFVNLDAASSKAVSDLDKDRSGERAALPA